MPMFTVSPRSQLANSTTRARSHFPYCNRTAVAFGLLCLVFVMPCHAGTETVISSVANCNSTLGHVGRWSNPVIWSPMQVPDNGRPPGMTYDVQVPPFTCTMLMDVSVTVNQLFITNDYLSGATANGISLTVLGDARIDNLEMANGKLDIGGTLGMSRYGWRLTDSKVKAGHYVQTSSTLASFARSSVEINGNSLLRDYSLAQLAQSILETHELELQDGALYLDDGGSVKVKGDFRQGGQLSVLRLQLNGHTDFTVDGNVILGGGFSGWLSDGYVPSIGEEFPILRGKGSIIGNWSNVNLPQLPAGRGWSLIIADRTAYLKVIPAP